MVLCFIFLFTLGEKNRKSTIVVNLATLKSMFNFLLSFFCRDLVNLLLGLAIGFGIVACEISWMNFRVLVKCKLEV